MRVLFCCDPLDPRTADSAFSSEAIAARDLGHEIDLIDHDALLGGEGRAAVRRVSEGHGEVAVYRGWMVPVEAYRRLHKTLAARGVHLINDPDAYAHAHHLPGWYPALEGHTPRSVWLATQGEIAMDEIMALLRPFGDRPVLLKDFVKSRKHEWAEACFIPAASDRAAVERVVRRFLELQGDALAGGLVFREFVALASLGRHPKSGMPLAREHRLFFADGEPVASLRYWDEAAYAGAAAEPPPPPAGALRPLAARVRSRFFTMDIAELEGGGFTIIEVGDGQVSGLPDHADRRAFYQALSAAVTTPARR